MFASSPKAVLEANHTVGLFVVICKHLKDRLPTRQTHLVWRVAKFSHCLPVANFPVSQMVWRMHWGWVVLRENCLAIFMDQPCPQFLLHKYLHVFSQNIQLLSQYLYGYIMCGDVLFSVTGSGCAFTRAVCLSGGTLTRASNSLTCKSIGKRQRCNPYCPEIWSPLCGSDGKTYGTVPSMWWVQCPFTFPSANQQ